MFVDEHAPVRDAQPADPGPLGELRALYDQLNTEVAQLGPVCRLTGRCCRFREYGHTLFVSALELGYLLKHAPPPQRALDWGESCPWQNSAGHCTAREARPLGCRVYYCDPNYQIEGAELSERCITQLKRLTERYALPWNYAPLHRHLHEARQNGHLVIERDLDHPAQDDADKAGDPLDEPGQVSGTA
jgi:hypothetical protein